MKISKYKVFLTLIFFQFVSFRTNDLDTQPWIFFFGVLFFSDLITKYKEFYNLIYFILIPITVQLIATLYSNDFDFISFIRGFISFLIFGIIYIFQKKNYHRLYDNYKFIFNLNMLFIIISLIQLFISPYFFNWLLIPRTSISRGVTSLTPEPTAYGILLLFFILTHILLTNETNQKESKIIIIINIISILFIAKSATATLYLILALILWGILNFKFKIKNIFFILISFAIIIIIFTNLNLIFGNTRLFSVLDQLTSNNLGAYVLRDQSIFDRVMATIFGFKSSFNNYFIPGGFQLEKSLNPINIKLFDTKIINYHAGSKLMSLWGALIAQLGFILFLVISYFSFFIYKKNKNLSANLKKRLYFILLMLIALGFTSITLSYSFLPFLIAIIFSIQSQNKLTT